ncbi:hypothetical protein A2U01_0053849, partial [Trifolium medium]|nr:hypothetical protein [Trifolium medium]
VAKEADVAAESLK